MSWVSHLGVVPLSHLPEFHSSMMVLGPWVVSQYHNPLAYSMLTVSSWVIGEPACGVLGRAFFSLMVKVFLGDMGVYCRGYGSRVGMLQVAYDGIVSWRERLAHAYELFSRSERISAVQGHWSVPVETVHDPLLDILSRSRIRLIGTFRLASWMLEFLHPCIRAPIFVFVDVCASASNALTLQVVCTLARMIVTSVLATKASDSDTRVVGLARP